MSVPCDMNAHSRDMQHPQELAGTSVVVQPPKTTAAKAKVTDPTFDENGLLDGDFAMSGDDDDSFFWPLDWLASIFDEEDDATAPHAIKTTRKHRDAEDDEGSLLDAVLSPVTAVLDWVGDALFGDEADDEFGILPPAPAKTKAKHASKAAPKQKQAASSKPKLTKEEEDFFRDFDNDEL